MLDINIYCDVTKRRRRTEKIPRGLKPAKRKRESISNNNADVTIFSIVKVAVFLMPTGTLRKITVCSSLRPPLENKIRLKSI